MSGNTGTGCGVGATLTFGASRLYLSREERERCTRGDTPPVMPIGHQDLDA